MNRIVYKWHRRIGIISAIFVFILAVTGLLLLLSEPLNLRQKSLNNPLIAKIYNQSPHTPPTGFKLDNDHWVVMLDDLVYVGTENPIHLSAPLIGAKIQEDGLISFSNGIELIITLPDGQLVERIIDNSFTKQDPHILPKAIVETTLIRFRGRGVPPSRVLLDIHTGSFFGKFGSWVMGLASVFLILLSISGFIMWTGLNKRKRAKFL